MKLYDGIKDVANIIQKADNVDLYKKLIDLSAQALDLQDENTKLIEEINKLKYKEDIRSKICRHKETYVTIKDDENNIMYCACCWDADDKLIQVNTHDDCEYVCPHCNNRAIYDKNLYKSKYEIDYDNSGII